MTEKMFHAKTLPELILVSGSKIFREFFFNFSISHLLTDALKNNSTIRHSSHIWDFVCYYDNYNSVITFYRGRNIFGNISEYPNCHLYISPWSNQQKTGKSQLVMSWHHGNHICILIQSHTHRPNTITNNGNMMKLIHYTIE